MPIKVDITPVPLAVNPYSSFRTPYQRDLLKAFRGGARLCVWRNSSPWNHWLEGGPDNIEMMYIAGCRETQDALGTSIEQVRALKALSRPAGASREVVSGSPSAFENGLSQSEGWEFDPVRAQAVEEYWDSTCAQREERQRNPRPFNFKLEALSENALALLRTLRSGNIVSRAPELAAWLEELDAQGLLELTKDNRFVLVPAARTLRLPRGLQLELVPRKT